MDRLRGCDALPDHLDASRLQLGQLYFGIRQGSFIGQACFPRCAVVRPALDPSSVARWSVRAPYAMLVWFRRSFQGKPAHSLPQARPRARGSRLSEVTCWPRRMRVASKRGFDQRTGYQRCQDALGRRTPCVAVEQGGRGFRELDAAA